MPIKKNIAIIILLVVIGFVAILYFDRRKKRSYSFMDNFTGDSLEGYLGAIEERWDQGSNKFEECEDEECDFGDRVVEYKSPDAVSNDKKNKCAEKDYIKIVLANPTAEPITTKMFGNPMLNDSPVFAIKNNYPIAAGGNWTTIVGDYAYITYPTLDQVGVLNLQSGVITYITGLPTSPKWSIYANGKIFITNGSSSTNITVIDANPQSPTFNTIISTILVSGSMTRIGEGILSGNNIYFSGADAGTDVGVNVIDTILLTDLLFIQTSGTDAGLTVSPTPIPGSTLIAVHIGDANNVDFIETDPLAVGYNTIVQSVATVGSTSMRVGIVVNNKLFITDASSTGMEVIDIATFTALTPINTGSSNTFTLNTNGTLIFASEPFANNVVVIDPASNSVLQTIALPISALAGIIYPGINVMYVSDTANNVLYVINLNYQEAGYLSVINTIAINSPISYNADVNPVNFPVVGSNFYVLGTGGSLSFIESPTVSLDSTTLFNMVQFNNAKPCFMRYLCNTQEQMNNVLTFSYKNILAQDSTYSITPSALLDVRQFSNRVDITELPKDLILEGNQSIFHVINPFETVTIFIYLSKMLDSSNKLGGQGDEYLTWEEVEALEDVEFNEVDIVPCGDECNDDEEEEDYVEEGTDLEREYI